MTILKSVLAGLPEWWTLVPDQTVFDTGGNTDDEVLNLGGRSATGRWIVAYLAGSPNVTVNMTKIAAGQAVSATWINPATGDRQVIGTYAVSGMREFTRPADWPDAVLVVEADARQTKRAK